MAPDMPTGRLWRLVGWAATTLIVLGSTVIVFRRGLLLGDEGYILGQSLAIANGEVPYRDLDMFVSPGLWLLNAWLFQVFEPSVLLSRVPVAICFVLTVGTACWVVRTTSGPTWAMATAALFVAFLLWAFPAWSFSFYSPFAAFWVVAAMALQVAWVRRPTVAKLFATGLAVGFAAAFKQNYGVYGAAAAFLVVSSVTIGEGRTVREAGRRVPIRLLALTVGGLCVWGPLLWVLSESGAGSAMFESLVLRPFQGFADHHGIDYLPFSELWRQQKIMTSGGLVYLPPLLFTTGGIVAWPWWVLTMVKFLDAVLYWMPAGLLAGGVFLALKPGRGGELDRSLLVIVLFAAFLFLGVFPRADFNHLANVYQPFLILSVVLVQRLVARVDRPTRLLVMTPAVVLFALYCGFGAIWLRDVRRILGAPLASERGGVLVDSLTAAQVNYQTGAIRALTAPEDSILAIPGLAMLQFLADRSMANGYYNYYAVHIGHDAGARAALEADAKQARLVISDYRNFFSDPAGMLSYAPLLAEYVRNNFRGIFSAAPEQQLFLVRRENPLPLRRRSHLLEDCQAVTLPPQAGFVVEHVLFRSLYQNLGTAAPSTDTLCRMLVPEDGDLRFALGMRMADAASPDAQVISEIWVLPETGESSSATLAFQNHRAVLPATGWAAPPTIEHTVDLRRYAGQQILLVFRSRLVGEVTMNPRAFWNFAIVWEGPMVESAAAEPVAPDDLIAP